MHKSKHNEKSPIYENANGERFSQRYLQRMMTSIKMSSGRVILTFFLAAGTSVIAFNAIILQPSRHPAPIFAAVEAARTVKDQSISTVAIQSTIGNRPKKELASEKEMNGTSLPKADRASEKNERTASKSERIVEKNDRSVISAIQPSPASAQVKSNPRINAGDALGEFIRAGIVPPATIPNESDPRLATVQRNLQRLGYPLGRADGMMGPGTRMAIEKFERDRKWPITGDVSQRLFRELGTISAGNRN
ncbi:MAG: peptidoglycan-binding domain-containing protein [Beijerinckiaceae bacterium]